MFFLAASAPEADAQAAEEDTRRRTHATSWNTTSLNAQIHRVPKCLNHELIPELAVRLILNRILQLTELGWFSRRAAFAEFGP